MVKRVILLLCAAAVVLVFTKVPWVADYTYEGNRTHGVIRWAPPTKPPTMYHRIAGNILGLELLGIGMVGGLTYLAFKEKKT